MRGSGRRSISQKKASWSFLPELVVIIHSLKITSCVTVLTIKRDESLAEPSENPFVPEVFTVGEEVYSPKNEYRYPGAHLLCYMCDEEIDTTLISVRET